MTKYQAKICRIILRHKRLDKILRKAHIDDWEDLQSCFNDWQLEESDPDEKGYTYVSMRNDLVEEFEFLQRDIFYKRIPLFISIGAVIISLFSINTQSLLWLLISRILDLIAQLWK